MVRQARQSSRAMSRLLITDDVDESWIEDRLAEDAASDLLILRWLDASRRRRLGSRLRGRLLDPKELAPQAIVRVREYMTGTIADLPRQDLGGSTLIDMLRTGQHSSEWWYLQTAERNPWRNRSITQAYRLALVRGALEGKKYDKVCARLNDAELAAVLMAGPGDPIRMIADRVAGPGRWGATKWLLQYGRNALLEVRSALSRLALLRFSGWRTVDAPTGGIYVFTLFPYFWIDPFGDAVERFFAVLPRGPMFRYLAWLVNPRDIRGRRKAAGATLLGRRIVPLQRYIGVREVLGLLAPDAFFRCLRARRRLDRLQSRFAGYEVGSLIAADIARSLSSTELFSARLLHVAVARFIEEVRPAAILYRAEQQPFERALLVSARGRSRCIAFRHTPFGENYLPVRLASDEVKRALTAPNDAASLPLPDAFLVPGEVGRSRLLVAGFPAERIAVCGPQRHPALVSKPDPRASQEHEHFDVYVAINTVLEDTEALFRALGAVVADGPMFRLIVRTHPALPLSRAETCRLLSLAGLEGRYVFAAADLYGELARSRALVLNPSTLAFEAMALGVMPIAFENPATFPTNSIADYAESLYIVRDEDELRRALLEVRADARGAQERRRSWPDVLRSVFADLRSPLESQLMDALLKLEVVDRRMTR